MTCVEALDECVDFEEGLFAGGGDERTFDWPVHRGHAHHGVFVVPPHGVTVGECLVVRMVRVRVRVTVGVRA